MDKSHAPEAENTNACVASEADCICGASASKVIAKADAIKLKQQAAVISLEVPVPAAVVLSDRAFGIDFVKPFLYSDSFYDLAPKRGPPIL